MLNPPVKGKIQGLFKAFECFSSTFLGRFLFQVLYFQVLFKPVRTLKYSSTLQTEFFTKKQYEHFDILRTKKYGGIRYIDLMIPLYF